MRNFKFWFPSVGQKHRLLELFISFKCARMLKSSIFPTKLDDRLTSLSTSNINIFPSKNTPSCPSTEIFFSAVIVKFSFSLLTTCAENILESNIKNQTSGLQFDFSGPKRFRTFEACFSKVPTLFGCIFFLQHMKRPALKNKGVAVLRKAFRARRVFGTFEKQAPGARFSKVPKSHS